MGQHYTIVNWDQRYEDDSRGEPWEPGQPFFQEPLESVRIRIYEDESPEMCAMSELCGSRRWAAIAVFTRLCLIVASEPRANREGGIIRNADGGAASDGDIARMLHLGPEAWADLAAALCHPRIGWLAVGAEAIAPGSAPGQCERPC